MKRHIVMLLVVLLSMAACTTSSKDDYPEAENPDPSLLEVYSEMIPPMPQGHWHIHDPTQVVKLGDYWMIGVTGKAPARLYPCGLETWYIVPGESDWTPGQCLFAKGPDWVEEILPDNDGAYWAPGFLAPRMMYYSVNGGDEGQCIGLVRATGNPPNLQWTDVGKPVTCTFDPEASPHKAPNSIDPDAFVDDDGSLYLVYGGGRIYITPLDAETGLQIEDKWWAPDDPNYHFVADKPTLGDQWGNDWIEAPFIFKHDGLYYLFVNWYGCCKGVLSTYEIYVGRSQQPTGPYVDQAGVDMRAGGGTLLIKAEDKYIGPGHGAVSELDDGRFLFSFHYYNEENRGRPWISVRELTWNDAGWPVLDSAEIDLSTIPSSVNVVMKTSGASTRWGQSKMPRITKLVLAIGLVGGWATVFYALFLTRSSPTERGIVERESDEPPCLGSNLPIIVIDTGCKQLKSADPFSPKHYRVSKDRLGIGN